MIKIGFIGNGKSTNRYHLPFVIKSGKFKVKTIWARQIRDDWSKLDGTLYTEDLSTLLDDAEIDVIVVTTPIEAHYEYAKLALIHGKHVILEKPFTKTVAESEELFVLASEKGLLLQGYQNRRFDSDFLTTLKVIESGKLGKLQEVEMHYDYWRPEVPQSVDKFSVETSFLYNHACHTLDQVVSYWGQPDYVDYDMKQLLGQDRMNDYFDLDLHYGDLKISVKSSYFRIKPRPSFVAYGDKGMFVKANKDRQEEDLKHFYMPNNADFGLDRPEDYGILTYVDENGFYREETVISEIGDYSCYYDALYDTLVNGREPLVKKEQTITVMTMLEEGIMQLDNTLRGER